MKTFKIAFSVACAFAFSHVASAALIDPPAKEVTTPSEKTGYSLKCYGWGRTIEDCYKKAAELCPNSYDIENSSHSVQGVPQGNVSTVIMSKDYMLISCKDAPVKQKQQK